MTTILDDPGYRAVVGLTQTAEAKITSCKKQKLQAKAAIAAAHHELTGARMELEQARLALSEAETELTLLQKQRTALWNNHMRRGAA